jgi:hypothetical protein
MIAIDFAPGLHGHFLEYVINKFIFGVPSETDNIFQSTGAAHCINWDTTYQKNKIAMRGHFSSFDNDYPDNTEKIVWIKHDQELDFVLLVNVFERCSPDAVKSNDFNIEDIKKMHLESMFAKSATARDLRGNWFDKLEAFHNGKITSLKHSTALPLFDFDYRSFFNLPNFILELEKTACFLSMTLKYDPELANLWREFMARNLGFKLYEKSNRLLEKIIANESDEIDNDWRMHAYINYRLSKIFRLHDGVLFEQEQYPTDTKFVHDLILSHVESFDSRF